jgi:hypothetical protein
MKKVGDERRRAYNESLNSTEYSEEQEQEQEE